MVVCLNYRLQLSNHLQHTRNVVSKQYQKNTDDDDTSSDATAAADLRVRRRPAALQSAAAGLWAAKKTEQAKKEIAGVVEDVVQVVGVPDVVG